VASFSGRTLRIFALASVLGMAAAGLAAATPASGAAAPIPTISHAAVPSTHSSDPFFIENAQFGNCVSYDDSDMPVSLDICGSTASFWEKGPGITSDGITYNEVVSVDNDHDCLGILGNSTKKGGLAYAWTCNGEANQYWYLDTGNSSCDPYYPYYNLNSQMVLGVEVNGEGNETIVQWPYQGNLCNNQFWDLTS
jgi:hypothetical protein